MATRALSIVAVLALTARCDIWERYEFSKALAPMASAKITRCMVGMSSGTAAVELSCSDLHDALNFRFCGARQSWQRAKRLPDLVGPRGALRS